MGKTMIVGFLAQKNEIWMAYVLDTRRQQEHSFGTYRELIRTGATDRTSVIGSQPCAWLTQGTARTCSSFFMHPKNSKTSCCLPKTFAFIGVCTKLQCRRPCPTLVSLTWKHQEAYIIISLYHCSSISYWNHEQTVKNISVVISVDERSLYFHQDPSLSTTRLWGTHQQQPFYCAEGRCLPFNAVVSGQRFHTIP